MTKTQLNNPQIKQLKEMAANEVPIKTMSVHFNVSRETVERYVDMFCPKPEPEIVEPVLDLPPIPKTTKKKVKDDDK